VLIVSAMLPSASHKMDVLIEAASNTGRGSDVIVLTGAVGFYSRKYGKWGIAAVPFFWEEGEGTGCHLTQCWAETYLHTKCCLDPSSRNATIHQRLAQTDRT